MRTATIVLVSVLLAGLLATPSFADTEPNDGITEAEGPLQGGQDYSGSIATDNDHDWYAFYATSQAQLDITVTNVGQPDGCCDRVDLVLRDSDGDSISSARVYENGTEHIKYTTPAGTHRFLLEVDGELGRTYRLRIDPASVVVTGPGRQATTGTGEPNESLGQAIGPLLGGTTYGGEIQTENDVDWFFFHTLSTRPFDISVTTVREGNGTGVHATLYSQNGNQLDSVSVGQDRVGHLRRTSAPGLARYYVSFTGDTGSAYELRIDPADAITNRPVEPCQAARKDALRWSRAVSKYKKKLASAKSKHARHVYSGQVKTAKKKLGAAQHRVAANC